MKRPVSRKSRKREDSKVADLEKRLAEALNREAEALEQQTATSEILRVISQSQTDLQPVFDTIVRSAVKLCGALQGNLQRFDGDVLDLVASYNWPLEHMDEARRLYPMRPTRSRGAGRAVLSRAVVHIPDVLEDPEYYSADRALAAGWRGVLCVPIFREGNPIGVITVAKAAPGPFSETHIEPRYTVPLQRSRPNWVHHSIT